MHRLDPLGVERAPLLMPGRAADEVEHLASGRRGRSLHKPEPAALAANRNLGARRQHFAVNAHLAAQLARCAGRGRQHPLPRFLERCCRHLRGSYSLVSLVVSYGCAACPASRAASSGRCRASRRRSSRTPRPRSPRARSPERPPSPTAVARAPEPASRRRSRP
ncbi:hypothetical protein Henu3_gp54 [Mycobacterium phage Henu3]|uniref:Uncharacterized protein n=1 Tax=Mycobacterium phage Henu3 TaxID=2492961 RepID=A0A410T7L5_9CAUD|nr:hypothetical protein I5G68_gp51 [Mycobacterium phage Henu3]QAU04997.1 hypothetical protein Henu3_gp54 [Mycobacterium phage Henu3]